MCLAVFQYVSILTKMTNQVTFTEYTANIRDATVYYRTIIYHKDPSIALFSENCISSCI